MQFTGILDKEENEIYEMDILLIYSEKFLVFWNEEKNGWYFSPLEKQDQMEPFLVKSAEKMKRFCSYFELKAD